MRTAHDQAYKGMLVFLMQTKYVSRTDLGLWDFLWLELTYARLED